MAVTIRSATAGDRTFVLELAERLVAFDVPRHREKAELVEGDDAAQEAAKVRARAEEVARFWLAGAADAYGQATPDSPLAEGVAKRYGEATNVRAFDGAPGELTEMDALVAYLQILGRLTDAANKTVATSGREGR